MMEGRWIALFCGDRGIQHFTTAAVELTRRSQVFFAALDL